MKKLARRGLSFVLSFLMVVTTAYSDMSLIAHAEEAHHVWTKVSLSDIKSDDSIAITMTTSDGTTYVLSKSQNSNPAAVKATVNGNNLTIDEGSDSDYAWSITKHTETRTIVNNNENQAEPDLDELDQADTDDKSAELSDDQDKSKSEEEPKSEDTDDKQVENKDAEEEKASDDTSLSTTGDSASDDADAVAEDDKDETKEETEEFSYYTIATGSKYLYSTAGANSAKIGDPQDASNTHWNVADNGYLSITYADNMVRYLGVYLTKPDWRTYKNVDNIKNQSLAFYKLTDKVAGAASAAAPTASVESGAVDFGTEVTLSTTTEDASIYYTVNGEEDKEHLFKDPIVITKDTKITAFTKLDDEKSESVSFEYTLAAGTKITDITKLEENQEFVLAFNNEKVLSTTVSGKKLDAVDVKVNDDSHLTYSTNKEAIAKLKLAKAETEGQYYITTEVVEDGTVFTEYLTTSATGSSLAFAKEKDNYSLWSFEAEENGNYLIKNVNAVYHDAKKNIDKPQYLEYYKAFTAYSYVQGDKKDAFILSAYTFPEAENNQEEEPTENTIAKLLTRELYNGDQVVVYYPGASKLMTNEAANGKLKDVDATVAEDGTIDIKDTGAVVLTVALDDNDNYSFKTKDGKYLSIVTEEKEVNGKKKTYVNLVLAEEATDNSLWKEESAGEDGKYYLKSSFVKLGSSVQALEYYSGFAAYGHKEENIYKFSFYALEEGEKNVKYDYDETNLTVAQWAGNAHYDEVETAKKYINGDAYEANDMLDKTAKYEVVVDGKVSQPYTSAKSTTTGSTSYYMGSTGVKSAETDYMQFEFTSLGYGNMSLEMRMRASKTAAGAFQLQYSTDGEKFRNLKTGKYSYKYTAYKAGDKVDENGKAVQEPFEVAADGDITDGIAKVSLVPTYYITFKFDIPNAAANAEKVYIRFVPTGDLNAKGDKAPSAGGVMRVDGVNIKGYPVIDKTVTGYVVATPEAGDISANQKISLVSKTEGADIFYSVNGGDFVKYDADEQVSLKELPATISAYAIKEGLAKSITVKYKYTQAQVKPVKAAPNGGAIFENQKITLKTKTEGATVLYRYLTDEEIAESEKVSAETDKDKKSETTEDEDSEESQPAVEDETAHDDWIEYTGSFQLDKLPAQIQVKAVKEGYKDSAVSTIKFTKKLNEKYNIYFGQIHSHTNISDGAGSLEEALQHASKVDNLDYIVVTDHSNSIDNEKESDITKNVDKADTDEWTYAHNLVKKYSTDKFTCAYGYEMTWSNGLGHMNTYNTPGFQSRTQTAYSTYSTALNNYYSALRSVPDSISQFNHPGTTFGDFQDFAYYSEENDALITMIEVGNGEGTIGSSGYFPSYEYYTRALDKGWHVAPTNNQDNHKGKWGDANTARTVMLADTNDETAIYDAMRNYRIYATEDNDLSIYYTLDGNIMGTILDADAAGDTVELKADISDPTDSKIGKVEVIVNGGQVVASKQVDSNEETVTFNVDNHYSYYYLKITQADGDIAVTAPVWVGEVEACGINKTYTNTVLPVKGESLDVNVDLYNNEKSPLEIESVQITLSDVDGKEYQVLDATGEELGVPSVAQEATATFKTDYVYNEAGKVTYEVVVNAVLNGTKKVYKDKLSVSYAIPEMVTDVIIDGTHYNDYVTGYYGGNVSAFISICASKNIRAHVETNEITAEMLKNCSLLVLSAPAKKEGTANAGNYKVSHYSDEFLALVKDYVANGGSVIVCGLADYSDTTDCQTATEQNKLLSAIGATIRMGSDEVWDDTNNGGQAYRMYPTTFNMESGFLKGIKEGQKYSQYSGCSVDISNAGANDFVDAAQWLVKGYDTTLSMDCKGPNGEKYENNVPNDNKGNVTFIATQHTKAGGDIFVAGGVFLSDFEVKAEMDNNDSLPYTNYTIVNNILDGVTVELPTSTIAQARAGKMNEVFAVEGYVTSGTTNPNTTFFDTIYIQDETAGIDIFPYATPGLAIGTKMRIVGYVSQYQGDKELKVISSKILDDEPYVWAPKEVDTKTAMDYDALGGSLLKTTGKVTRVKYADDGKTIEEFWLDDGCGSEAAIFIDGYIYSGTTGKNEIDSFVKVGAKVSAAGVLYMHPEGDSEVSVPVFRVRDCDDIQLVSEGGNNNGGNQSIGEKIVEGIKSFAKSVSSWFSGVKKAVETAFEEVGKAIAESPIGQTVRRWFGRGTRTAQNTITAEAPLETTTPEEPTVDAGANDTTATIAEEQAPKAAANEEEKSSIPVVPVAAASVIIVAGAGIALAKTGKFALLAKLFGK